METSKPILADPAVVLRGCQFAPQLTAPTRDAALTAMVAVLVKAYPVMPETELLRSVFARERLRATGTPEGVAFPHGKHAAVDGVCAVIATTCDALDFGGAEYMPCRILVLTASSAFRSDGHLHFLAHMAQSLRMASVRAAVLAAQDKHELIQALRI